MFPFAGLIFQAAMFWVIMVVIARKVSVNWLTMLLWYVLAIVTGIIAAIVLGTVMGYEQAIIIGLIRVAVVCVILYVGLRQMNVGGAKEKFTILGLFYSVSFGIDMILEVSY